MIAEKCFTKEWIDQKSVEFHYADKNLIEKVIRAFSLLDMLASSGCPFYFKGGSCIMLLLNDSKHRLSIDIDIMCPPGINIEDYLKKYTDFGFIDYELVERKQQMANVPKSHSKFFYRVAYRGEADKRGFILLDVLYEDCHYLETLKVPILHDFIEVIEAPEFVCVPSISNVLGDKLTAFAPETTGIPYYKKGNLATLEIIKQLFDLGRLIDKTHDLRVTTEVFRKIAQVEMGYRGLVGDLTPIHHDIRNTALNISTRGFVDQDKFMLLQQGIKNINPFMYKSKYYIEDAIIDASKVAYVSTLIQLGKEKIDHYTGDPLCIKDMTIGFNLTSKLNKLRVGNPEAFYYWVKTSELLERYF